MSPTAQEVSVRNTQKMKFSIKGFFIKCDIVHGKLRILSHLLTTYLMEYFIICAVSEILCNLYCIEK